MQLLGILARMNHRVLVRGAVSGLYYAHDYAHWHELGREAFLAHQMQRYDRFMASPSLTGPIVLGIIWAAQFALYEGIVAAVARVTSRR